jgi:hypothetical protein
VWLLDIDYAKREAFAYSCEAFSRLISRAKTLVERRTYAERSRPVKRVTFTGEETLFDTVSSRSIPAVSEARAKRNEFRVRIG